MWPQAEGDRKLYTKAAKICMTGLCALTSGNSWHQACFLPHLHLIIGTPDRQLKHEPLNGLEEQVDCSEAGRDDHVSCRLRGDEGVAVPVTAHPAAKGEQVVVQRQVGLPDLGQRCVDAAVEGWQTIEDSLLEVGQALAHLVLHISP